MNDIYDDDLDMEEELLLLDDLDEDSEEDMEGDDMLDMMMDELADDDAEDLSERRRRWRSRKGGSRRRFGGRRKGNRFRNIRTASRRPSYRPPVSKRYVTHPEFKKSNDISDTKHARSAAGIKTLNERVKGVDTRVDGLVEVNKAQTVHIRRLTKQMRIDGALEFAESYDGTSIDIYQLLKGAVKSGMLDSTEGAFSNPLLVGALGFLLRNPGFLGQLTGIQGQVARSNP